MAKVGSNIKYAIAALSRPITLETYVLLSVWKNAGIKSFFTALS
jgi:hypothetical protein